MVAEAVRMWEAFLAFHICIACCLPELLFFIPCSPVQFTIELQSYLAEFSGGASSSRPMG
jgi:hypothetical protein